MVPINNLPAQLIFKENNYGMCVVYFYHPVFKQYKRLPDEDYKHNISYLGNYWYPSTGCGEMKVLPSQIQSVIKRFKTIYDIIKYLR